MGEYSAPGSVEIPLFLGSEWEGKKRRKAAKEEG
jgi:hypothetical protein